MQPLAPPALIFDGGGAFAANTWKVSAHHDHLYHGRQLEVTENDDEIHQHKRSLRAGATRGTCLEMACQFVHRLHLDLAWASRLVCP